ncbi:MAG: orotidine-5'-phosphate decarboxylase [Pyrinomonadaceae bacterium]
MMNQLTATSARDKLIVALDVETAREARELFQELREVAGMFKIGSQLFTAAGPQIVREIIAAGRRVFLDLKFHDIPNTVAAASVEATRLGVAMLNVHASGGGNMMRRTAEAVAEVCTKENLAHPILLAVTVLTSDDAATLAETGTATNIEARVGMLAALAHKCGINGVVASPHEVAAVRARIPAPEFVIVTPGVRPQNASADDQKRIMTPFAAVRAGADYIVIGRAILNAPDPMRAAREIVEEMSRALESF